MLHDKYSHTHIRVRGASDTDRERIERTLHHILSFWRTEQGPSREPQQPVVGLKLHLGCGEVYLEGYVNIDFPSERHTVQTKTKADVYADIRDLSYPASSVAEVRSHHVFEHFDRGTALRLLVDWYEWLRPDGSLIIETPDFERCVRTWLRSRDEALRMRLLRHVFGSHEADWAVHRDGWYQAKFDLYLRSLGFVHVTYSHTEYRGLHNITVLAHKGPQLKTRDELLNSAEQLLRLSVVDSSDSEMRMLDRWMQIVA